MKDEKKFLSFAKGTIFFIAAILILLLIPVPALVLDILIALNLIFALALFIIVLNSRNAAAFTLLPTSLLVSTIFNLAVYISAARLILTKGPDFDGRLIQAVASFAAKSGYTGLVIGYVLFILITAVQIIVVVKGTVRVAEVAARFTLDSMQVKMMAVETEHSSGSITEEEAQRRKAGIQKESDFLGALDGASKFISGNEKVRILIIAVSTIGGILIGTLTQDQTVNEAAGTYIPLVIGSGFLFLLHGLLLSLTVGIVVTRTASIL